MQCIHSHDTIRSRIECQELRKICLYACEQFKELEQTKVLSEYGIWK